MQTKNLDVALHRMVSTILENARAESAGNILLSRVLTYVPPAPLVGADGVSVTPWPASVTVQPVMQTTRIVSNLALKRPTEIPIQPVAGGFLVASPEAPVLNVPVLFFGSEDLALTSPPLPGSIGLLFLTGKHHASSFGTGLPEIPRLVPSSERTSDSVFVPGFILGSVAAALPPSAMPMPGISQLGPRTIEAELVHLRRQPGGWIVGGTDIRLGSVASTRPASGVGDTCALDPTVIAFFGNVVTALGVLGQVVVAPASATATITTGAPVVKLP